ncbi:hypothetical protein Tco_1569740 [Tanacetum coccineum]
MSSSSSNRSHHRGTPPTHCVCEEPVILQTSKTIDHPMRRFLGCINYYRGSKCKTFYWVDPELPSVYYKQEVFKLLQKVNLHQTKMNADKCRMTEMEREFDFQKSTLEKQVLALQMELKESKANVGFYRKLVVIMCVIVVSMFVFKL